MATTKIEWTASVGKDGKVTPGKTWSPLRVRVRKDAAEIARQKGYTSLVQIAERMAGHVGPHCERISAGCGDPTGGGCYAEANNHRCLPANGTGLPYDRRSRDLVEMVVDEKILIEPLSWKAPRKIFPMNQSDIFGEWWTDDQIDRVFAVMALCPWHTLQVLTKRPARMLGYVSGRGRRYAIRKQELLITLSAERITGAFWPLQNAWLGFSAENQETFDARWAQMRLIAEAGWTVWVSLEPLLGPIDIRKATDTGLLRWAVAGAESGHGARPFNEDWVRDVKNQCVESGVAFFYKQGRIGRKIISTPELDGQRWTQFPDQSCLEPACKNLKDAREASTA